MLELIEEEHKKMRREEGGRRIVQIPSKLPRQGHGKMERKERMMEMEWIG
jgi:hypothetical protein